MQSSFNDDAAGIAQTVWVDYCIRTRSHDHVSHALRRFPSRVLAGSCSVVVRNRAASEHRRRASRGLGCRDSWYARRGRCLRVDYALIRGL